MANRNFSNHGILFPKIPFLSRVRRGHDFHSRSWLGGGYLWRRGMGCASCRLNQYPAFVVRMERRRWAGQYACERFVSHWGRTNVAERYRFPRFRHHVYERHGQAYPRFVRGRERRSFRYDVFQRFRERSDGFVYRGAFQPQIFAFLHRSRGRDLFDYRRDQRQPALISVLVRTPIVFFLSSKHEKAEPRLRFFTPPAIPLRWENSASAPSRESGRTRRGLRGFRR